LLTGFSKEYAINGNIKKIQWKIKNENIRKVKKKVMNGNIKKIQWKIKNENSMNINSEN
jgi:hypothetical protein